MECPCDYKLGGKMATGKGNQSVEEVKSTTGALEISPSKSDTSSKVYGKGRKGGEGGGFKKGGYKK